MCGSFAASVAAEFPHLCSLINPTFSKPPAVIQCGQRAASQRRLIHRKYSHNTLCTFWYQSCDATACLNGSWEKVMTQKEPPSDELIVEILRYLVAHPRAKDTIDGIEKWWLPKSRTREGKRRLEKTLNWLADKGWLIARSSPRSETIYSLNENGLDEIRAFLKEHS